MAHSPIFVLHGSAKEQYARQLTQALAPYSAIAAPLSTARALHFGRGAICVIIWTPGLDKGGVATEILPVLRSGSERTIVCCLHGVAPPPEFAAAGFEVLRFSSSLQDNAAVLKAALDNALRSDAALSRLTPSRRKSRKSEHVLIARSAVALAATMGIIAIAIPFIQARPAQSTAIEDAPASVGVNVTPELRPSAVADVLSETGADLEPGMAPNPESAHAEHDGPTAPRAMLSIEQPEQPTPTPLRVSAPSASAETAATQAAPAHSAERIETPETENSTAPLLPLPDTGATTTTVIGGEADPAVSSE
jgi:hypothetical protein